MPDSQDLNCSAKIVESDTVIAETQAKFDGFDVLKAFNIPHPRLREARQPVENIYCGALIDGPKVSLGLDGPGNFLGHF